MEKRTTSRPWFLGIFRRILILLLIGSLMLSAGCTPKPENPDPTQPSETTPPTQTDPVQTDPEETEDPAFSLAIFRQGMVETPYAFAAAYFGYHYNMDSDDPVDPITVMQAEAPQLCTDLPFLTAIPEKNQVGADIGELYCIVPRDEDAAVSINRGVWDEETEGFVYEDVIYRGESGEPVLLLCNTDGWQRDTQVTITCSDGTVITWYPETDIDLRCIAPLRGDDGTDLLWDFSPYGESLAKGYREFAANGWEHPTEVDLVGTTWGYYTYLRNDQNGVYRVTFREDTCTVRWNDGTEDVTHEYPDAAWELTREGAFTILSIDFGEFAGVRRYNLLLERTDILLYIMVDASEGFVQAGQEPLDQLLEPIDPAPDPAGMVGTWELAWTEVEGDRNDASGRATIVITEGDSDGVFRISMTDHALPELSFRNKKLVVSPGELYHGCGNAEWVANVDYVGLYDTLYSMTLLEDGTILVQDYWEFDGMPMVSYGCYRRAD